ncbi:MAG: hypothetical protein GWM98_08285, partial [Nitrospinaceae bacterium]|nr:protein BatD [Nitrospinaceae bacterium]NIR54496.1 protein BatD [Nitrospinaceae bacterium]NIS84915.1 protein BatD [Nitrospinaceae bacterium]NIT81729.1 protein BatD [Nitrospinaceae bacterium]NIU43998.1 protein BatD [Nitrospinaceae bacterium]
VEVRKPAETAPASQLPAFVETTVSDKNPYVHQQVIYTFRLFRQVEAKNFNLDMPVDSSRFLKKEMGDAKRYSRVINGIRYEVHELSVALFPLRPGRVELAPAILELDLLKPPQRGRRGGPFSLFFDDPFFGPGRQAVHKILRTEPQPLTIRPLPKSGQPKDFANLVGQFEIDATLSKQEMEVGDSTTLTVTVSGTGSVKGVTIPLETLEERFKIYPDQPETRHSVKKGRMVEEKTFRFALVPLRQGRPTLPAVSISYFDPEKEDYLTQSTSPRELRVLPSSSEEPLNLVQSAPDSDPSKPTV